MKMYTATIKEEVLEPKSRKAYYFRLKLLFILVMTLVSVVPLIGISYFSFRYYKNSWIDRTSIELASLAESREEVIGNFLANQDNLLVALNGLYSPQYLSDQANLEHVFDAVNSSGVITDLGVIGSDGKHRAYVGPYSNQLAGRDYKEEAWFVSVMDQGKYTSDIFSGFRGVPHIVVAETDPARTMVLRATVNSDLFNSLLAGAEVGPGGDAFILNRSGEPQTPSRLGSTSTPFSLSEVPSDGSTAVFRDDDYLYATASLKDGDWVLVLKENVDSSLAEFYSARNRAIIIILLAITTIASVATLLTSSLINRIRAADRQRTAMNERMRDVEKMALIGRLAASVAHEINNPLQIIENQAGWINELIEDEEKGQPGDLKEYGDAAEKIRAHVRRAKMITQRLLGFSRTGEEARIKASVNRLINETVTFLEDEAEDRHITIKLDLKKGLPEIKTDPSQLQQVFLNIVNNALEAIRRDGIITITTSITADGRVRAEFSDNGPGLGEGVRDKLFEPFFTTKDGKGTGLGLSISYNIIQRLGGDIEARNLEQGGSYFAVTMPVEPAGEQGSPEESR